MMGAHHAASGAAAWVVIASDYTLPVSTLTAPLRDAAGWLSWLPETLPLGAQLIDFGEATHGAVISGAVMMAGAALLPDADHRGATLARSLPPLSTLFAVFIGRISGGHRHGTHSIIGVLVATLAGYLLGLLSLDVDAALGPVRFESLHLGAGLITVLLSALAFKALKFIPEGARRAPWAAAVPFAVFSLLTFPPGAHWLALVVGLGCLIHILGDFLTTEGVNWFWPLHLGPPRALRSAPFSRSVWRENGYTSLPLLGGVSSLRAHLLGGACAAVAVLGVVSAVPRFAAHL